MSILCLLCYRTGQTRPDQAVKTPSSLPTAMKMGLPYERMADVRRRREYSRTQT
ncbi:hypothetical protein CRUP_028751, partial [Coryphaenoides rupestris]